MTRYLMIQRLGFPELYSAPNPFSFGGGRKNGGFSDETYSKLLDVLSFDYMGAAEYEWGDVPKAFNTLWKLGENGLLQRGQVKTLNGTVYYLCPKRTESEVITIISALSAGELLRSSGGPCVTRDPVLLREALNNKERQPFSPAGGINIGDEFPFLFTVDSLMFDKLVKLFPWEAGAVNNDSETKSIGKLQIS